MKSTKALVSALLVCGAANSSLAQELLWRNLANGNTTSDDSMIWADGSYYDAEVADDFDVMGSVERVLASGYSCFNSCSDAVVAGVYVRFYQSTPANMPGTDHSRASATSAPSVPTVA